MPPRERWQLAFGELQVRVLWEECMIMLSRTKSLHGEDQAHEGSGRTLSRDRIKLSLCRWGR